MTAVSIQSQAFTVQATQPWQSTGVAIPPNVAVTIAYQSGLWTADPPTNDGQPYDAAGCPNITVPADQPLYPITGVAMGALVGRLDGGAPFLVGDGPYTILSASGGALELCINDDLTAAYGAGLADNIGSVTVYIYPANTPPDTSVPLATDPAQASPGVPLSLLGPLQYLIGTWTNQNLPGTSRGGRENPYSYNVMPLPQVDPSSPYGYILKNFSYYEELTFTAIHGNAPNRGGTGQQVSYTLFYEQRVFFGEGPNKDALVHAENGSLLLLLDSLQPLGPYGNGEHLGLGNQVVPGTVPTQQYNFVKQVAVPHGNSILALGTYSDAVNRGSGVPVIPTPVILPVGVNTDAYKALSPVSNPQPALTADPNQVLRDALTARPCTHFLRIDVSTQPPPGAITNIGYEQQHANVSRYDFTYWLEAFVGGDDFTQLQYSQTIELQIPIGGQTITFPHVTANTLTKVSG